MTDVAVPIAERLFAPVGGSVPRHVYAVADGAAIDALTEKLCEWQPPHACLYSGELPPDLQRAAPYLIELTPESPFTTWMLAEGWGSSCGIYLTSQTDLRAMRRHWRGLMLVRMPDASVVYFRLYDPRVMRVYLPSCNAHEAATVFGPIGSIYVEDESPARCLRFDREHWKLPTRTRVA